MSNFTNRPYANAYANKILGKDRNTTLGKIGPKKTTARKKTFHMKSKPIDKHGNYDGTDVGFTSTSIQDPIPKKNRKPRKKPIDRHGNYEGTDAGFTVGLDE